MSENHHAGANLQPISPACQLNRATFKFVVALLLWTIALGGCQSNGYDPERYTDLNQLYDVTIRRDVRGVPHVLGATNADVAFGFAYAQAEDNWQLIEEAMPFYRGNMGRYTGFDGAVTDYLIEWLGLWQTLEDNYRWDLSPDVRKYLQAYADGLNFYAATHLNEVDQRMLPISPQDVVAGFMVRHLMFYGFEGAVTELLEDTRQREVSAKAPGLPALLEKPSFQPPVPQLRPPEPEVQIQGLPIGSNAFAVAPHKSDDGATRLAINSHQPTTGPVAWYEAALRSDEGLNVMGGLFPGSPMVSVGFTPNLGWAATVNRPDLVDIFVLEINPDNPQQYRLDGQWRDLVVREVDIELTLLGFIPWTSSREVLRSEHGPVLRTDHGTYAVRYAGMGELRQVEQWYRMNLANDFDDWKEAMRLQSFASFNFVYADKDGHIMFLHNSLTPKRALGYDWQQYLPGDDSSLIWRDYLPFGRLPQVVDPAAGFVHSANQTPFQVTEAADNPRQEEFAPGHGFQQDMTNRAHRGLELFAAMGPLISAEEFSAIKHDKYYSPQTHYVSYLAQIAAQEFVAPSRVSAQALLREWDLGTQRTNRHAALGTCVLLAAEARDNRQQDGFDEIGVLLDECINTLMTNHGRLDPLWGDVNRHVRGDVNVAVGGGPDILRAIYGRDLNDDGFLTNVAGDGLYYLVEWDAQGRQKVQGIHQFGSATLDKSSPHYADQAMDFAEEILHDPLFEEAALQQNLLRAYRPGEE